MIVITIMIVTMKMKTMMLVSKLLLSFIIGVLVGVMISNPAISYMIGKLQQECEQQYNTTCQLEMLPVYDEEQ